jgi:hypothetical protein
MSVATKFARQQARDAVLSAPGILSGGLGQAGFTFCPTKE